MQLAGPLRPYDATEGLNLLVFISTLKVNFRLSFPFPMHVRVRALLKLLSEGQQTPYGDEDSNFRNRRLYSLIIFKDHESIRNAKCCSFT
jgi:hypothetical protein